MKSCPILLALFSTLAIGFADEMPLGGHHLAKGIVNSTWTWSRTENDPAPKETVTIHADGTVTWSDRPALHSPYTVVDEYTIHQNQSTWHFSHDLKTLTVESDPVPIRWGKRKE